MPRRPTHLAAGLVAGAIAGLATSSRLPSEHQTIHIVFATIGGVLGGIAPDIIEPATSPGHRGAFHSLLMAGGATAAWRADWLADCHGRATTCDARALTFSEGSPERNNEFRTALFWRALGGLIVGFIAGYASHLALDACTARSLPLLMNGF